jgi:hypothetical protein
MRDETVFTGTPAVAIDLANVPALTATDPGRLVRIHNRHNAADPRLVLLDVGALLMEILRVTILTVVFIVRAEGELPLVGSGP